GFERRENLVARGSPTNAMSIQQESTFWRRSLWDKAGARFDNSVKLAGDFELWDRFFDYARLYSIDVPLAAFRRYDIRQRRIGNSDQYIAECEKVLSRHLDTVPNSTALNARRLMFAEVKLPEFEQHRKPIHAVRRQDDGRYIAGEYGWKDN